MNTDNARNPLLRFAVVAVSMLTISACGTSLEVQSSDDAASTPTAATGDASQDDADGGTAQPTAVNESTVAPDPTPTPEPTATPTPIPGQLTVNDTDAVGTVGDELLSLVEAVQLANGRLTVPELSDTETEFVSGEPGPSTPDTITVVVGDGVEILSPGGDVWIVELFGNNDDTVIGGGAVLSGGVDEPGVSHNIMLIGSANVTIEGFTFRGVTQAVGLESAGQELDGISLENNAFIDNLIHDITVQNSVSGGSVTNLTIAANSFESGSQLSDLHRFIVVQGANSLDQQVVEETTISNLTIENNAMSAATGSVQVCISISGGFTDFAVGGEAAGASVETVALLGNTVGGCTTGVLLAGGHAEQTGATLTNNTIADVTLSGNTMTVGETAIAIRGGYVEPAPASFQFTEPVAAQLTGNAVRGVSVDNSIISAYGTAFSLVAGEFAVPGTGLAEANTIAEFEASEVVIIDEVTTTCVEVADLGDHATGNVLEMSCTGIGG